MTLTCSSGDFVKKIIVYLSCDINSIVFHGQVHCLDAITGPTDR